MESNPYVNEPMTRQLLQMRIKEWEEILANDQDTKSQDIALAYLESLRKELKMLAERDRK